MGTQGESEGENQSDARRLKTREGPFSNLINLQHLTDPAHVLQIQPKVGREIIILDPAI